MCVFAVLGQLTHTAFSPQVKVASQSFGCEIWTGLNVEELQTVP